MVKRKTRLDHPSQLMLVAAVIDGLHRETSLLIDDAAALQYRRLSDELRRCASTIPPALSA